MKPILLQDKLEGRARCPQRAGRRTAITETVVSKEQRRDQDITPYLRVGFLLREIPSQISQELAA